MKKIDSESNLLQDVFDLAWNKYSKWYDRVFKIRNPKTDVSEIFPTLPDKIDYELPKREKKEGIFIPIGYTFKNKQVTLDLKSNPHTVITGVTGAGKSVCTKEIITTLMNNYSSNEINLYFIDFKIVELSLFKRCTDYVKAYVTEIEEAKELLADLMEECKRRYRLFDELEVTNIWDYNKLVPKEKQIKKQIIVIEEFVEFTQDKKKVAMTLLKRFSSLARASGQYLIVTGQRFDNTVIDLVLRNNLSNRIVFQMSDEANSKLLLGRSGAEKIDVKGRCHVKVNANIQECQSYYISDKQVKSIIKPYIISKKQSKNKVLASNENKGVLETSIKSKDKLQDKQNKIIPIENKKVQNITNLDFLDNL
ncbi:FtsK/SpoIIIE family protein [Terrisporobacter glycolicus]|nr:FtsK/SpoIIIE family protein [Terrisporobacter glycolicus]